MSKRTPEYQKERLKRINIRKQKRKEKKREKHWLYGHGDATCPDCGGKMTWCSSCQCWTRTCCVEYGTCQCS